jgi:hypothetical protein
VDLPVRISRSQKTDLSVDIMEVATHPSLKNEGRLSRQNPAKCRVLSLLGLEHRQFLFL